MLFLCICRNDIHALAQLTAPDESGEKAQYIPPLRCSFKHISTSRYTDSFIVRTRLNVMDAFDACFAEHVVRHTSRGCRKWWGAWRRDADPDKWGVAVCTTDGQVFLQGGHRRLLLHPV